MHLQDRSWRISYSSNENNPIADFYIPALECAVNYDRKSGFFGSAILSKVARGIGAMLHNHGKMRLIMGCQFSPQDIAAIEKGYELREALAFRLDAELIAPENFVQLKHFEILSWLIKYEYLDIKIAVPTKDKGIPIESDRLRLDPNHIFHEKVGIFTDSKGDRIAFSGSNNESLSGWERNVESFHVYCDWEGDRDLERVNEEAYRFEQLWNDLSPNVKIFALPEAVKRKLLKYTPDSKPSWKKESELKEEEYSRSEVLIEKQEDKSLELPKSQSKLPDPWEIEKEKQAFEQLLNIHQHPGCLDFCLKSIPIQPWAHQLKILRRVADKFPCSFLIADEVGLGKTIETGLILRYLIVSQKVKRVLILAPASVQPQWQEELREKFNLHFWSYSQGKFKDCYGKTTAPALNPWNTQDLVLASSHLVRRTERIEELLAAEPWDLVILDEAHHARRKSPQQRKDTPNRLLQLMQRLRTKTESLILLSATPMQIDPIEVFDLLDILGLAGHWSYGENFCNYFASLSDRPDSHTLDFWQTMSVDYFGRGGKECTRLGEHLTNSDRLLAYKLRDTWKDGKNIVNPKKLAKDTQYTDTMDYLRENLQQLYGSQVACYSGRGGELYRDGRTSQGAEATSAPVSSEGQTVPKEQIKKQFREGTIKLLLCTESASEGLNLQTCGVLINYDLPWNPMRVEQRIGRIDRIGQVYSTVHIHNFYYDGTVEAKVYRKLRDRIDAFQTVVGNLQPILAQVPTFIEQAVMSADPEEEGVLLAEFEQVLDTPPLRPGLEEMSAMDVQADLKEIRKPLISSPITPEQIEALFTNSQILLAENIFFELKGNHVWELIYKSKAYSVTFYPEIFDENPSLRLMTCGEPLFEKITTYLKASGN